MTRISTVARRATLAVALALVAPIGFVVTAAAPGGAAPTGRALPACTKTWTAGASGSWDTAASWSGGTVPTATDHVCLTQAGTYTVTLADPGPAVTVASLRIGNPEPGTDNQTLVVARGVQSDETSLTATEGIEVRTRSALHLGESPDAAVSVGVGAGAVLFNTGTVRQVEGAEEDHTIRGDVVNAGTFRLDKVVRITGALTTDGQLVVNSVLHVEDTVWTKGGTVRGDWLVVAHDGLRVGQADTARAEGSPPFTLEGGTLSIEADSPIDVTVRNAVTVTGAAHAGQSIRVQGLSDAPATLSFTGTWTNLGYLTLDPAASPATVVGDTLVNLGDIERLDTDGGFRGSLDTQLRNRGVVRVGPDVLAVGSLVNEGLLDVGTGQVWVAGDLDLLPAGTLAVAVDGSRALPWIDARGHSSLAGVLAVETGTAPAPGQSREVLRLLSRTGTFDELVFIGSASYDPYYTVNGAGIVRRASEPASQRFVRAAHQDFLGRQPTSTERTEQAAALDSGTLTRATLVRSLARSPEYVTALVQRFYLDTLGRPGDPDGVAFWVERLRSGRNTVAEVAGSFYASQEYFERAGGNTSDWVFDLYEVFFERAPSSEDQGYWAQRAQARGRTRVATELFQSLESRRQRVERLYIDLLGRPADVDGRDYWAGRLTREGDLALAVSLASSGEYLDRAQVRYP